MCIRQPTCTVALMCAALAAVPISQAVAQMAYPGYGTSPLGVGPGGITTSPHPGDFYNGATITTPGSFRDRFRQQDSVSGVLPCDPSSTGLGSYGQVGRQSNQPGMFHDRFADFRRPDPSELSAGGGPDPKATADIPSGCR